MAHDERKIRRRSRRKKKGVKMETGTTTLPRKTTKKE